MLMIASSYFPKKSMVILFTPQFLFSLAQPDSLLIQKSHLDVIATNSSNTFAQSSATFKIRLCLVVV